MKDIQGELN